MSILCIVYKFDEKTPVDCWVGSEALLLNTTVNVVNVVEMAMLWTTEAFSQENILCVRCHIESLTLQVVLADKCWGGSNFFGGGGDFYWQQCLVCI